MKIIAIIPARGGSKGVPRKNVKLMAGKPMISYSIEAVKRVQGIDRVIVSTDDQEIAVIAKQYGAEVPFMRPAELATDAAATLSVLQHVLNELQCTENYVPDYVLLVYPTSPLLRTERIQAAVDLALAQNADSVVSGMYDKKHYWIKKNEHWQRLYPLTLNNRQWSEPLFKENGAIYLSKTSVLEKQIVADTMLPLVMDEDETIDVDTLVDFEQAEKMLRLRT